ADGAWLSKGLPSMLVTGLAQTPDIEVVATDRLNDAARQVGRESVDAVDRARLTEVARRAGATFAVTGTIVASGGELRIDARVEDLEQGRVRLAASVRGRDPLALADDLAARIRQGLDVHTTAPVHRVADVSSPSVEAYRLYSEGMEALNNVRFGDARTALERAVAIDTDFSLAYLQLALIEDVAGNQQSRRTYLTRAAEHLDRLPERDAMLVRAQIATVDERFDEAARIYEALIARYPDSEAAYYNLMLFYVPIWGPMPDPARELAVIERGVRAVPSSAGLRNQFGYAQLANGQFDEAIRTFESLIRLRPNEANGPDSLADGYLIAGDPAKAIELFSRSLAGGREGARGGRAWAYAVMGRYDEALQDVPTFSPTRAFILARAGRYDAAMSAIEDVRARLAAGANQEAFVSLTALAAELLAERGQCARAIAEADTIPRAAASILPRWQSRPWLVLADVLSGICEARGRQIDRARARLERAKSVYLAAAVEERWWVQALAGEIALAGGSAADAESAFAAGEPSRKMAVMRSNRAAAITLFANNLPSRDGRARALAAQGRIDEAIAAYRQLLTPGRESKWTAFYEPRYVLAIARLLDRQGQRDAAREESRRFLALWKNADPGLPEIAEARRFGNGP
ncbi:MAG TPA: tetratricopeptide repeat protein, partial [Vicinamibacterales bacterium]